MKAKKWVTFITAGISVISLICAIVANCSCVNLPLMYDISMAIFGSALLGFIMSWKYFERVINIPNDLYQSDWDAVYYISDLLRGQTRYGEWKRHIFTFNVSDDLKKINCYHGG